MAIHLGLRFSQRLQGFVRHELEQLVAAVQTQVNVIGAAIPVPREELLLSTSAATARWTLGSGDYGYVEYTRVNDYVALSVSLITTTLATAGANELYLLLPGGFQCRTGRLYSAACFTSNAGVDAAGLMYVDGRRTTIDPVKLAFQRVGGWGVGAVVVRGQLLFVPA